LPLPGTLKTMRIASWIAAAALCSIAVGMTSERDVTSALRVMHQSLTPQRDNSHLNRLAALRSLRDPALRPIFADLVEHEHWPIQVHGVLGLAELSDNGIDAALIMQLDPAAREQALLVGFAMDAVTSSTIETLLQHESLEPHLQTLLLRTAVKRGMDVDVAALHAALKSDDPRAVGTAAVLLAARGDAEAFGTLDRRLMTWEPARQLDATFASLSTLSEHASPAGVQWIQDLLEADTRPGPRRFALLTLLQTDPAAADTRWMQAWTAAARHRDRVDLALLRLMAQAPFPPNIHAVLKDDALLLHIAQAGSAVTAPDSGDPASLVSLVDTGHGRSIEWLLDHAAALPPSLVQPALERLIEQVPGTGQSRANTADRGLRAAQLLHGMAPQRMRQLLADAPDDGPRQQALLMAALQLSDRQLKTVAESIRQIGLNTADAMTLLLRARWAEHLSDQDMNRLSLAVDGSRLSEPLRAQAAWLMLKHSGHIADVMQTLATTP